MLHVLSFIGMDEIGYSYALGYDPDPLDWKPALAEPNGKAQHLTRLCTQPIHGLGIERYRTR